MKYMLFLEQVFELTFYSITIKDGEVFTSFPAEIGNPNYDAFLKRAKLTDKKVKALTPQEWIDL
jgi:hypothetical protein